MPTKPAATAKTTPAAGAKLLKEFTSAQLRLPRRPGATVPVDEGDLGRFVNRMRDSYRLGKLTAPQIRALEAVPHWTWAPPVLVSPTADADLDELPEGFRHRYVDVLAIATELGSVPIRLGATDKERRAAEWCRAQRLRRTSTTNPHSPAEKHALEVIPGWFWERESTGTLWRARYDAYAAFVAGHGRLPARVVRDLPELRLHDWARTQRSKKTNTMLPPHTPAQVDLLEQVPGWAWRRDDDTPAWEENLALFEKHWAAEGRHPRELSDDPTERRLYRWVAGQRDHAASGKQNEIYPERSVILEETPGWSWTIDRNDEWLETYAAVVRYVTEFGKFPAQKARDADVARLGTWCGHNRRARARGKNHMKMTPGRVAVLDLIPGWYWVGDPTDFSV